MTKDLLRKVVLAELVAGTLVVTLYAAALPWSPGRDVTSDLERQYTEEVARLESMIATVEQVVNPLHGRLLDERDIPKFLGMLSQKASDCGFELELLTPGGIRRDPGTDVAAIDIDFKQPFPVVVRYLHELEALPYLFGLQVLQMMANAAEFDDRRPDAQMPLDVTLSLSLFLASKK